MIYLWECGDMSVKKLRFWVQKVLPLVYDDSLSYYELLCKVVDKLNETIEMYDNLPDMVSEIEQAIAEINKWIDNFETTTVEKIISEYLATMIFVEIPDGHIVYYIPESWDDIQFETTGYDVDIVGYDYGHLVLNY